MERSPAAPKVFRVLDELLDKFIFILISSSILEVFVWESFISAVLICLSAAFAFGVQVIEFTLPESCQPAFGGGLPSCGVSYNGHICAFLTLHRRSVVLLTTRIEED